MNVLHYFHNTYIPFFLTEETNEASAGGSIETTAEASPGEGAGMTGVAEM